MIKAKRVSLRAGGTIMVGKTAISISSVNRGKVVICVPEEGQELTFEQAQREAVRDKTQRKVACKKRYRLRRNKE